MSRERFFCSSYGAVELPGSGDVKRDTSTFAKLQESQGQAGVEYAEVSPSLALNVSKKMKNIGGAKLDEHD